MKDLITVIMEASPDLESVRFHLFKDRESVTGWSRGYLWHSVTNGDVYSDGDRVEDLELALHMLLTEGRVLHYGDGTRILCSTERIYGSRPKTNNEE